MSSAMNYSPFFFRLMSEWQGLASSDKGFAYHSGRSQRMPVWENLKAGLHSTNCGSSHVPHVRCQSEAIKPGGQSDNGSGTTTKDIFTVQDNVWPYNWITVRLSHQAYRDSTNAGYIALSAMSLKFCVDQPSNIISIIFSHCRWNILFKFRRAIDMVSLLVGMCFTSSCVNCLTCPSENYADGRNLSKTFTKSAQNKGDHIHKN